MVIHIGYQGIGGGVGGPAGEPGTGGAAGVNKPESSGTCAAGIH